MGFFNPWSKSLLLTSQLTYELPLLVIWGENVRLMKELFMNLTSIQQSWACCQAPHKYIISLLLIGLLFIPWLWEQFLSVTFSVSTKVVYSSPEHVEIHWFLLMRSTCFFQRQNQSYCRDSTMSEKDQFLEEEQLSQTPLGQNWSDTIQYPFSPGSTFFFSLRLKAYLWELSRTAARFKGQNTVILTEFQSSSQVCHLYPE